MTIEEELPMILALCISILFLTGCKKSASNDNSSGPTVTDIDGNVYHTVAIGTQTWMVENLKVTHYRNGDLIVDGSGLEKLLTDTIGIRYAYDNTQANLEVYGWLYNWYAGADGRNIAPIGWHVPSDADYKTLVDFLGGNYLIYPNGDTTAGGALKEAGVAHWGNVNYPNVGATNTSGWTGLPGGLCEGGVYANLHTSGNWWTTTTMEAPNPLNFAYNMGLFVLTKNAKRSTWLKTSAYSIRCLSDQSK